MYPETVEVEAIEMKFSQQVLLKTLIEITEVISLPI